MLSGTGTGQEGIAMTEMMENVLAQFETLMDVVRRASNGDYVEEIAVTGDHPVGRMAGGLQTVFADIVATKQRLAEAERRLLATNRAIGVFELGSDGVVTAANQPAAALLARTPAGIEGQSFRSFFHPEQNDPPEIGVLWDCFSRGLSQSGEYSWLTKNGDSICVWVSMQPINGPGEPSKFLVHALQVRPADDGAAIEAKSTNYSAL